LKGILMKVGNKVVLINQTLFVPEGEMAEIEHLIIDGDFLKCRFKFIQGVVDEKYGSTPFIRNTLTGEWFEFEFVNFTNSLGGGVIVPNEFALSDKKEKISYLALVYKLNTLMKLEIQIMLEPLP
jgi:hypothetical protein